MRIDSSAVLLSSERSFQSGEQVKTSLRTIGQHNEQTTAVAAETESTSLQVEESRAYSLSVSKKAQEAAKSLQDGRLQRAHKAALGGIDLTRLSEDAEITLIEQILNAIDKAEGRKPRFKNGRCLRRCDGGGMQFGFKASSEFSASFERLSAQVQSFQAQESAGRQAAVESSGAYYSFSMRSSYVEMESTSFTATGIAKTADGREISFDVEVGMTREFARTTSFYSAELTKDMKLVDPLVINVDANVASVANQKFLFDINADGKVDEISRLNSGSGFLALDRDGSGKIEDGSELFGARTGNGFSELAAFDEDGNGWIDEADSVYNRLQVWVQDADGTDRLLSLQEADVGAIYLDSASTKFSLNNASTNATNAVVQRSGVYLKESGGAGTIQHVDFAL